MEIFKKLKQRLWPPRVEVIVLGHQKSGTTVIATLLGKISGFEMSNDPLYCIDYGKGEAVDLIIKEAEKLKFFQKEYSHLLVKPILKDPDFIFVYPFLRGFYQSAKYLFVIRDPRDTIRSICNRLGMEGTSKKINPKTLDMGGGNRHWELILSGCLPLQDNVSQSFVLNLAHRWNLAAKIYLDYQDDMVFIKYETFIKSKEATIVQLANDLALPQVASISDFVDVQYQPKGDRDVAWLDFFGESNLREIETICANYMSHFGYLNFKVPNTGDG